MPGSLLRWCLFVFLVAATPLAGPAQAPARVSSGEAHATLQRVLSRGEFRDYRQMNTGWWKTTTAAIERFVQRTARPISQLLERLNRAFARLDRFLKRLMPSGSSSNPRAQARNLFLRYLLYGLLILAILVLLGLLLARLLAARRLRQNVDAPDAVADDPALRRKGEPSFWERSQQQAEALWAAGNQREALRVLTRACLVLLDARGILRYDESRANGEVLRALRRHGHAQVHRSLRPIVGVFDRSWYGLIAIPQAEFQDTLEHSRRFREAVVEGPDA